MSKACRPEPQRSLNRIIKGDCLGIMKELNDSSIDLIYADPPFFSNRLFKVENRVAFDDRWEGGIGDYLDWLYPRLLECHRVLRPTGSIYLHLDTHSSHYAKVLMDRIFGLTNFLNEIIWKRQSAHNDYGQGSANFGKIHDTILLYSKSSKYVWNQQFVPYSDEYVQKTYKYIDETTGRRFALGDLTGPGGASKGNPYFEFLGVRRYWRYSKSKMVHLHKEGRIWARPGKVPVLRRYLDEMLGVQLQDVWIDCSPVRGTYPTEKPASLIERMILTSSMPNALVLDPFCGSGSSLLAASNLCRNWIGIDDSDDAIAVASDRLGGQNINFQKNLGKS